MTSAPIGPETVSFTPAAPAPLRPRFAPINRAVALFGVSRSMLYRLVAEHPELFRKMDWSADGEAAQPAKPTRPYITGRGRIMIGKSRTLGSVAGVRRGDPVV